MKNQKLALYVLKLLALLFLAYLSLKEQHSRAMLYLIGYVAVILIWEGIRDFGTKSIRNISDQN